MATKTDPADQVKFLVACIRSAGSGRPDFDSVASQLGIVSKAAAQKRYERMLKAYNVNGTAPPASGENGDEPATPKKTPAKKRGGAKTDTPPSKRKKATPKAKKPVKEEDDEEGEEDIKPPATPTKSTSQAAKGDEEMDDTDLSSIPPMEHEV